MAQRNYYQTLIVSTVIPFITVAANDVSSCNGGFVLVPLPEELKGVSSKCYRFFDEKYTFEDATAHCIEYNATLATPKYSTEAQSLARYVLKHISRTRSYWVGLTDQEEEGIFKWSDDGSKLSKNFTHWSPMQPDSDPSKSASGGEEQDCVKIAIWILGSKSSAQFYDYHCNKKEAFICEAEPIEKPVVTYVEAISGTNEEDLSEVSFLVPKNITSWTAAASAVHHENSTSYSKSNDTTEFPMVRAEYRNDGETSQSTTIVNTTRKFPQEVSDSLTEFLEPLIELPESEDRLSNETKNSQAKKQRTCALQCKTNRMRAACPLEYFPRMKGTKVSLNNATCRPRSNGTHLIVITRLDRCGTVVENVNRQNKLAFRNTIYVKTHGSGIVRQAKTANGMTELMTLECRYPQKHQVSNSYKPADGKPPVYKTQGIGEVFDHTMLLYKSDKYEKPYAREEYPIFVPLSKRIFIEVESDAESENVEIHPLTCYATPDSNPFNSNNYILMQDGCIEDETFRLEDSNSRKVSRLSVDSFRFVGYFHQVYIHCNLIVCRMNSESSPSCPFACNANKKDKRRLKRDDEIKESAFSSHSGMIRIARDSNQAAQKLNTDGSRNRNAAYASRIHSQSRTDSGRSSGISSTPMTLKNLLVGLLIIKKLSLQ